MNPIKKNKSAYLLLPWFFKHKTDLLFDKNLINTYCYNEELKHLNNHLFLLFDNDNSLEYKQFKNRLLKRGDCSEYQYISLDKDLFALNFGNFFEELKNLFLTGQYHLLDFHYKKRILEFNTENNKIHSRIKETLFLQDQSKLREDLENSLGVKINPNQNCVSVPNKEQETYSTVTQFIVVE